MARISQGKSLTSSTYQRMSGEGKDKYPKLLLEEKAVLGAGFRMVKFQAAARLLS